MSRHFSMSLYVLVVYNKRFEFNSLMLHRMSGLSEYLADSTSVMFIGL